MTTESTALKTKIEHYFASGAEAIGDQGAMDAFLELRGALSAGHIRAAEPDPRTPLGWRVNAWVKQGILLGFRLGTLVHMAATSSLSWTRTPIRRGDSTWKTDAMSFRRLVRPRGRLLARGVICMPPMYVNAGAYVDEGTHGGFPRPGWQLRADR